MHAPKNQRPVRHLAFILALLLFIPSLAATKFTAFIDEELSEPSVLRLSADIENVVFGLSRPGYLRARFNTSLSPLPPAEGSPATCPPALSICQASDSFVRAPSFERRHAPDTSVEVYSRLFKVLCEKSRDKRLGPCLSTDLKEGVADYQFDTETQLKPNELYLSAVVACSCAVPTGGSRDVKVQGDVQWANPGSRFPELGWEEAAFPLVTIAALIILGAQCVLLLVSAVVATLRGLKVPRVLLLAFAAAAFKALYATVTFLYFWGVAQNGTREPWYLYTRLSLVPTADIIFICVAMAMASGYRVLPDNWFVDGRSPIFLVYIGVTLQILIIIAVKLMFPFRYLGVLTYTAAAGVVALLMCIASYRNYNFLGRYTKLIERAHIYVRSTPIPRMRLFYIVNVVITTIVYLFKIISVGIWDYKNRRPDLMWGSLEIADATLLLWYTFALLPRKKSAIYVDLSHVSDERLQLADAWRASQAEGATGELTQPTNGLGAGISADSEGHGASGDPTSDSDSTDHVQSAAEEGRSEALTAEPPVGPQPPWVEWSSGMSLPRPDSSTWGGYVQVPRMLRRERRLVPVLPSSIILGTPSDSPDTLKLNVGMPTTGPSSVPKVFDDKGVEVAGSSFRSPARGDALSARVSHAATGEEQHSGQESGSERRIRLGNMLQGLRLGNLASRTATGPEMEAYSNGIESTALEPSEIHSVSPSQRDSSPLAPSVASSNASCDGVLFSQEDR